MSILAAACRARGCSTSTPAAGRWASRRCPAARRRPTSSSSTRRRSGRSRPTSPRSAWPTGRTVHRGDALRFAERLAAGAFDLALADPPYTRDDAARLVALFRRTPFARILSVEHGADRAAGRRRHPPLRRHRPHLLPRPMTRIAIYPGSFDPPTKGHEDLIRRSLALADRVIVAVAVNPSKQPLFPVAERLAMLRATVGDEPRVTFESFDGLLAEFARKVGASMVVRGLRAVSDFEYEFQMALMNRQLHPDARDRLPGAGARPDLPELEPGARGGPLRRRRERAGPSRRWPPRWPRGTADELSRGAAPARAPPAGSGSCCARATTRGCSAAAARLRGRGHRRADRARAASGIRTGGRSAASRGSRSSCATAGPTGWWTACTRSTWPPCRSTSARRWWRSARPTRRWPARSAPRATPSAPRSGPSAPRRAWIS